MASDGPGRRTGLAAKPLAVPAHFGVDEKAAGRGQDYITLVSDVDAGTVEFIADERRRASLDGYFEKFAADQLAQIQAVAMDMWEPFANSVRAHLADAEDKIVFDRSHLMLPDQGRGHRTQAGEPGLGRGRRQEPGRLEVPVAVLVRKPPRMSPGPLQRATCRGPEERTYRVEPNRVTTAQQAAKHLAHRHPARDLAAVEQLKGRHRHHTGAVGRSHPWPLYADPARPLGSAGSMPSANSLSKWRLACRRAPLTGLMVRDWSTALVVVTGRTVRRTAGLSIACRRRPRPPLTGLRVRLWHVALVVVTGRTVRTPAVAAVAACSSQGSYYTASPTRAAAPPAPAL